MSQKNNKIIFLEYFNQGSESLFFYKDTIMKYLKDRVGISHYHLLSFNFLKVICIIFLPVHILFVKKKDIILAWDIIRQLSPRRYKGSIIKKLLALLLWEFRFFHFKSVVFFIKPNYFLCTDSAFFLMRWLEFCKKKKIIVLRDFTDLSYCFSIIRQSDPEIRFNFDFDENSDEIDINKLKEFSKNFEMRLDGISKNIDHVLANNPQNAYLEIKTKKIKVLLAAHILGDAASAHISMFQNFEDWTVFFLKYFANRNDDYLLIVKEHPAVSRYAEEGLLFKLLSDSGYSNNVIFVPSNTKVSFEHVDIVITGNGSIAHEYIYRNKPVFSTSGGFCKRYKGCFFAQTKQEIIYFFDNKMNIFKLKEEAEINHEYNLKMSYIFHKCPNLLNNERFRKAFESRNYHEIASFFDDAGLIEFIFNSEVKNHYFILKPKLVS